MVLFLLYLNVHSIDIIDAIIASRKHIKHKKVLTKRHWRNNKIVAEMDINKHLVIITKNGKLIDAKLVNAGLYGNFSNCFGIIVKNQ